MAGIPWMLAFALRADGWWLRSDIIWHKPNPMPESVTDRPTRAHEYIFLLSKSERYYYNHEAIQEPAQPDHLATLSSGSQRSPQVGGWRARGSERGDGEGIVETHRGIPWEGNMRNKRTVWTIPTEAYSQAHFATFPRKLVEPCLLAGSRVGDIVLDPFFGSGTVGQVAENLGRQWIGIDLNREYVKMSQRRTAQMGMQLE